MLPLTIDFKIDFYLIRYPNHFNFFFCLIVCYYYFLSVVVGTIDYYEKKKGRSQVADDNHSRIHSQLYGSPHGYPFTPFGHLHTHTHSPPPHHVSDTRSFCFEPPYNTLAQVIIYILTLFFYFVAVRSCVVFTFNNDIICLQNSMLQSMLHKKKAAVRNNTYSQ